VTIRERDGMTQVRIHLNEVKAYLQERVTWNA
jgi:glycyl-tRNA synthetase (class II)